MRRKLGRRVGLWAALLVLPGVLALEPVAAERVTAAAPPPKRMPEVTSPPLQEPESSIPSGDHLGSVEGPIPVEELLESGDEEIVERRDAITEVFANDDGSETVKLYSEPVNYQPDGSSAWEKVDNSLVADTSRPGWVRNAANDWTVRFGPVSAGGSGGVELVTDGGVARFAPELPASASPIAPVVGTSDDSTTVTYPDVWPGVDVRYTVSSSRVKEEIVVEDGGRSSFPFVTEGLGLTDPESDSVSAPAEEGLDDDEGSGSPLVDAPVVTGAQAGRLSLAPVTVAAPDGRLVVPEAAGTSVSVEPVAASSVVAGSAPASQDSVASGAAETQRFVVSVDEAWMAEQADADEPVVIDPTIEVLYPTDYLRAYEWIEDHGQQNSCWCNLKMGRFNTSKFRTAAKFPYWDKIVGRDILSAGIWLGNRSQGLKYIDEWGNERWVQQVLDAWVSAVPLNGTEPDFHSVPYWGPIDTDLADEGAIFDVTDALENAQLAQDPSVWWGFTGEEEDEYSFTEFNSAVMVMNVNRPAPAPTLSSPEYGSLAIATLTPTLRWSGPQTEPAPPEGDSDVLKYRARISTNPDGESGFSAQSAEMDWSSAMSWSVPEGVLRDGVTYYWSVSAWDGRSWTKSVPRRLTVDRRMGLGGLSPSDSFGAVTTNLVTGNPSLTVSGPLMPAVGGGVGVNFTYNGRQSLTGLTGTYHEDGDKDGETDDSATDPVRLVRNEPAVNYEWVDAPPGPGVPADWFWVRFAGTIRFPSHGTWELGQRSDDGVRLRTDGNMLIDDWNGGGVEPQPVWQTADAFTAGSSHRLSLDYKEHVGPAQVQLWARNTAPGAPPEEAAGFVVQPD